MQLTRRDALLALGGVGTGAATVGMSRTDEIEDVDRDLPPRLLAVAEAIYPSAVSVDRSFIDTYVLARFDDRREYVAGQAEAAATLDRHARRTTGRSMLALDPAGRRRVLGRLGVARAHPNPDGAVDERIRYYIVNDLLYVLFSTPIGGELVGCENPPGYPGGTEAYQRPPEE